MSRKYTKIDQYEKQILSMREEGKHTERLPKVLNWKKNNKKMAPALQDKKEKIEAGIPIRTRGQHRKNSEPKNIIADRHMRFNA